MQRAESGDPWLWALVLFAVGNLANAVWMLFDPGGWYAGLPAAVPDTGPFNPHFVRDIGCAFLATGMALVWAAFAPHWRTPLLPIAALFLGGHALVHVYDTTSGALGHTHWWLDAPGVYLPALLISYAAIAQRGRAQIGGA